MSVPSSEYRIFRFIALSGLCSAAYIPVRNILYYPYLENDRPYEQKQILYSDYAFTTLSMICTFPFSLPMTLISDIQFVEHKLRKIPFSKYERPFFFCGFYSYKDTMVDKVK
jgi:hypothetical protein